MTEKFRVTMDGQQNVVKVEANIDGKWVVSEKVDKASDGAGALTEISGCGQGTTNCPAISGYFVFEYYSSCYYFPC